MKCSQCGKVELTSTNRQKVLVNNVIRYRDDAGKVTRTEVSPLWKLVCTGCYDAIHDMIEKAKAAEREKNASKKD